MVPDLKRNSRNWWSLFLTDGIQVTIINGHSKQDCDEACGTDWSLNESLDLARQRIKERFEGNVELAYLDVASDRTVEGEEWIRKIDKNNLSTPLLVLNGQVRISGNFDIRQMLDVIEAEMEMGV
jgi:glutaredoxin